MRLGFLHLGERGHGLHRYGRLLAEEARRRPELAVHESELVLSGDRPRDAAALRRAGEELADCELVHLQHNKSVWGGGWAQLANAREFSDACRRPLVATLHDVYPRDPWTEWRRRRSPWRRLKRHWQERAPTNRTLVHWIDRCAAVTVCSDEELARLRGLTHRARPVVIDHFVEEREALPPRDEARRRLGWPLGARIVTVLGYIHPSKGHDLAVRALRKLPDDVHLVLAGAPSPGNEPFVEKLEARAERHGVRERLRVTGYLDDEEQACALAATDLALAPFRFFSASGSLSTWISSGRPILCHALPQLERYEALQPGAIATFAPFKAAALARAVERGLAGARPTPDPRVAALRERLRMPRIFERHLGLYRTALAAARG